MHAHSVFCLLFGTHTFSANSSLWFSLSTLTRAGLTGLPYDLCHLLPKLRVLWVSKHKYAPATHKHIRKLISKRFLKIRAGKGSSNSSWGIWCSQTFKEFLKASFKMNFKTHQQADILPTLQREQCAHFYQLYHACANNSILKIK